MFGVPLVDLVTSQGDDIPKIIRRIVEHVEKNGKLMCTISCATCDEEENSHRLRHVTKLLLGL